MSSSLNGPWTATTIAEPSSRGIISGCGNPAPWVHPNSSLFLVCGNTKSLHRTENIRGPWVRVAAIPDAGEDTHVCWLATGTCFITRSAGNQRFNVPIRLCPRMHFRRTVCSDKSTQLSRTPRKSPWLPAKRPRCPPASGLSFSSTKQGCQHTCSMACARRAHAQRLTEAIKVPVSTAKAGSGIIRLCWSCSCSNT